jgi:hypothetical protein
MHSWIDLLNLKERKYIYIYQYKQKFYLLYKHINKQIISNNLCTWISHRNNHNLELRFK